MENTDATNSSAPSGRGILKDVRHIHEAVTLLILDISEGADTDPLNMRLRQVQELASNLSVGLIEINQGSAQHLRIVDPSICRTACEKCLLQVGENRSCS